MQCFNPNKKHSDVERWICIYPAYINSKKTKKEGRILRKDKCAVNPTAMEIVEVLGAHKMEYRVESKMYSREKSKESLYRGRIRVHLKNDDGTPLNPDYPTRESVMFMLGDMIPKLKSRVGKQGGGDHQNQQKNTGNQKKDKGKGKRR